MPDQNIFDTILTLEAIVDTCLRQNNPHGLFAALYLKVTRTIRDGIEQGQFDDNARMERFDVVFAQRYIDAFRAYQAGAPTTEAWKAAFDASANPDLLAIQHLFLGMNAHINLDLGITAAQISQGAPLEGLQPDFNKINEVLFRLQESVQSGLNRVSPAMWLIDWFFKDKDEQFAGFSMRAARTYAWGSAQMLHGTPPINWEQQIALFDQAAATMGRKMASPGRLLSGFIQLVRRFEHRDVAFQIQQLLQ